MLFNMTFSKWSSLLLINMVISVLGQIHYATTGVFTGIDRKGARPARRSIVELQNDVPSYSLFVQAWSALMQTPEDNLTSYFQVAGIHGRPYMAWDNVNPSTPGGGVPLGYCPHGNTLFAIWHRPYLALIEQIIADHAQAIAKTYNSAVYRKAADDLRLPYWDWAAPPYGFPAVLSSPTVQIETPSGFETVNNPLFQYTFLNHPEPQEWFPTKGVGSDAWFGEQPFTVRWPDAYNQSQNSIPSGIFSAEGGYLASQVWNVFAKTRDYNSMSTNGVGSNTFENPHGAVHVWAGGNGNGGTGHMNPVSFSAFDPLFWLHHANVDRQFAMWQAIYPNSWITPTKTNSGTWTIYPGTQLDGNTPLAPFTMPDGKSPWTPDSARYTKTFGYSYPEVKDWIGTPSELTANVSAAVNRLYNPDGLLGAWPSQARPGTNSSLSVKITTREWSVSLEVPNCDLGEGYSVGVTVGDVKIGMMFILSAPTQMEMNSGFHKVTKSEFTLSPALQDVDTEDVEAVVAILKDGLNTTVLTLSGNTIPADQLGGLRIVVQDTLVIPATDITKFPTFGDVTTHPEVTE